MPHRFQPRKLLQWLRISVRGLIGIVLIIGAGLGWIVHSARIQREAVMAIQRDGGFVTYDWEYEGPWDFIGSIQPSGEKPGAPEWLVNRLGVDFFGPAKSVALGQPGSPTALSYIGRLSHVERLELQGPFVTDAGLAQLKGLTSLCYLDIGDRYEISDGTIVLQGAARVTDAGMAHLKGLAKLSLLDLNGTQVSDAGLANLSPLTQLKYLRLADTRVTDVGLVHLEVMARLEGLDLSGTRVTDAGLTHLKTLIGLTSLSLRGTRVTDAGLAHLEGLAELSRLDLSETGITDAGLAHLKGLSRLWDLDLRGTNVSRAGFIELQVSLPRRIHVRLGRGDGTPRVIRLSDKEKAEKRLP